MNKAILYTRVSTKKQNTDRQVAELTDYAHRYGFEVVITICETVSGSVKKVDRPGLEQVQRICRLGFPFDRL